MSPAVRACWHTCRRLALANVIARQQSRVGKPLVRWVSAKLLEALMPDLNPSHIMQVGMGFFASKTLLSAVELGLFTELSRQPMTGAEIAATLGLNSRAVPDFPDALVALGFLQRASEGAGATYTNTTES